MTVTSLIFAFDRTIYSEEDRKMLCGMQRMVKCRDAWLECFKVRDERYHYRMAVNAVHGCYCCATTYSAKMDIDAALNELGMLSTVTESRQQYLKERMRTRSESALMAKRQFHPGTRSLPSSTFSSQYQIVHIDTKYVTGFSDTQDTKDNDTKTDTSPQTTGDDVFVDNMKHYRNPPDNLDTSIKDRRSRMRSIYRENISSRNRRILARKRARQPYEVPWRLTQSFQESDLLSHKNEISESKSNSSSPVKSYSTDTLPRSRSLDNLDFSSFCISEKQELDKVACDLKNLHVTDT